MQRDKRKIENSLEYKGFQKNERHHHFFVYYTQEGKKTQIMTKTSHTQKKKTISEPLLNQMARQCKLTSSEFLDFIDCPMDQNKYESILKEKNLL
jgi:hypothetical protein